MILVDARLGSMFNYILSLICSCLTFDFWNAVVTFVHLRFIMDKASCSMLVVIASLRFKLKQNCNCQKNFMNAHFALCSESHYATI